MASKNSKKVIVWAVDPFEKNKELQKSAVAAIKAMGKSAEMAIHPVYVCSPAQAELVSMAGEKALGAIGKEASYSVKSIVGQTRLTGLEHLRILRNEKRTLGNGVRELLCFAKSKQAELIVVSSHGRTGPVRWMLGSFAETLSLHSDVPLLIVNPQWKKTADFKKFLFPTDFSRESKSAFAKVVDLAARENGKITIFTKLGMVGLPAIDLAYAASAYYDAMEKNDAEDTRAAAAKLAAVAKKKGVPVTIEIDRARILSVAESILKRAAKDDCVIAMAAQSGKFASALLGSTTRQVIRGAKQPVWIIHPDLKKEGALLDLGLTQDELSEELCS